VAKLNVTGAGLVYSTYLGGNVADIANAIAVDAAGNAYVAGWTYSTDFPTQNPLQAALKGGLCDAFVAKIGKVNIVEKMIGVTIDGVVVSIDQSTGAGNTIGNCGFVVNSLAKDSSGTLYSASGTKLITINPMTGAGTEVATLNFGADPSDVRGLAFSPDNVLYAVVNGYSSTGIGPDHLYTVNVSTGVASLVGDTGLTRVQSLDFSPSGVLYGWDVGLGLITINTTTGVATDVNPSVGATADIQGIVFSPDGILYGACNAVYKIDVATGATTLVGSRGYSDVRGLEFGPAVSKKAVISPVWLLLLD
jgi:hypothetical protein